MKVRRISVAVVSLAVVALLAGCVGGGTSSFSQSEITAFFALYEARVSAQNVDALVGMHQLPLTVRNIQEGITLTAENEATLRQFLESLTWLSTAAFWELTGASVVVGNASGNATAVTVEGVLTVHTKDVDDGTTYTDIYESEWHLAKRGGQWRIQEFVIVRHTDV